jgi:MYXO-CTERM domain-containing protein
MMRALLVLAVLAGSVAPAAAQHAGIVSPVIYLERCKGGCVVRKGADDARGYTSTIPDGAATEFALGEFKNSQNLTGAAADEEWNLLMQCVREVYSPFAAVVTDVKPTNEPQYHMNIVAGLPSEVGLDNGIQGVSPGGTTCDPVNNWITFTFANSVRSTNITARTWRLCQIVAQETAHSFGLDHSYSFGSGPNAPSACKDPMTYRGDCGGQKFFRNEPARCGEYSERSCGACGPTQNSHQKLMLVFGPGNPITPAPSLNVKAPVSGATVTNNQEVLATASSQRGIYAMELWINGYMWKSIGGVAWGANGQPEVDYGIRIPAEVPDGVMDIVVKAKDDIDLTTESPVITVTKGAPCASADSCLEGQKCEAGKCFWDPPAGQFGDTCEYPQFCSTGTTCAGKTADQTICTRGCVLGVADSCDEGYECVAGADSMPICWPGSAASDDGICSVGEGTSTNNGALASLALSLLGLVFVVRRRRR